MKELGKVAPAEKPQMGKALNEAKNKITAILDQKKESFEEQESRKTDPSWDSTLPGRIQPLGKTSSAHLGGKGNLRHFSRIWFLDLVEGPDVENRLLQLFSA